jgi:hypothetical protein
VWICKGFQGAILVVARRAVCPAESVGAWILRI